MARPTKQGLDYFPLDNEFDDKVQLFLLENGAEGLGVLITTWQLIYTNGGYYMPYNDDLLLLIRQRLMMDTDDIRNIIDAAVRREIFTSDQLSRNNILTAPSIQRRYFIAAKRKTVVYVNKNYLCTGVSDYKRCTVEWVCVDGNTLKRKGEGKEKQKRNNISAKISDNTPPDLPKPVTEDIKIAQYMADIILKGDPGYRYLVNGRRETTLHQWAKDIEKINRLDKREWGQIWSVTRWCLADEFWKTNILSGSKLRKKFDQLVAKMTSDTRSTHFWGTDHKSSHMPDKVVQ